MCGTKKITGSVTGVACEERAGVQGGHTNTGDARWPGEMRGDVCVVL